jgi:hypothetical protein
MHEVPHIVYQMPILFVDNHPPHINLTFEFRNLAEGCFI